MIFLAHHGQFWALRSALWVERDERPFLVNGELRSAKSKRRKVGFVLIAAVHILPEV